jgi:hypothetical protein
MNTDRYPMYAAAFVAGAGIAVWAGLPLTSLFLLICPVMMFFMMRDMGGTSGGQRSDKVTGEGFECRQARRFTRTHRPAVDPRDLPLGCWFRLGWSRTYGA